MNADGQSVYVLPAAGAPAHGVSSGSSSATFSRMRRGTLQRRNSASNDDAAAAQTARRVEARTEFARRERRHASRQQQHQHPQLQPSQVLQRPLAHKNQDLGGVRLIFAIEGRRALPARDAAAPQGVAAAEAAAAAAAGGVRTPAAAAENDSLHAAPPISLNSSAKQEARGATGVSAAACRMLSAREALRAATATPANARAAAVTVAAPAVAATTTQLKTKSSSNGTPIEPHSSILDSDTPQHIVERIVSRVRRRVAAEMSSSSSSNNSGVSSSNPWGWQRLRRTSRTSRRLQHRNKHSCSRKHSGAARRLASGSNSRSSSSSTNSTFKKVNKSRHRHGERPGRTRRRSRSNGSIRSNSSTRDRRKLGNDQTPSASLDRTVSPKAKAEKAEDIFNTVRLLAYIVHAAAIPAAAESDACVFIGNYAPLALCFR